MPRDSIHIDDAGQPWSIRALLASNRPRRMRTLPVETVWARTAHRRRWGPGVSSPARLLAQPRFLDALRGEPVPSESIDDTDEAHIGRIAALHGALAVGRAVPPLVVGLDGTVWDGVHRLAAMRARCLASVDVLDFSDGSALAQPTPLLGEVLGGPLATEDGLGALRRAFGQANPYRHVYFANPLHADSLDQLVGEMEPLPWQLASTHFYDQYEVSLLDREWRCGPFLQRLQEVLQSEQAARHLSALVGRRALRVADIACHRSLDGQSIGLHNDVSPDGEVCRLTFHLSPGWTPEDGGHFVVFGGTSPNSAVAAYPPVMNTAILFEIGPSSHHAVTEVTSDKPRYSIVAAFAEA